MNDLIKTIFSKFRLKTRHVSSNFYDVGFHGDKYLLSLVGSIAGNTDVFIETGTNVGSTLAYVARTHPHVSCLGCEPVKDSFESAIENTKILSNVMIYNETSQKFMHRLDKQFSHIFKEQEVMFWLDAHGYGFKWPLKEEIAFITTNFGTAYIFLDDFKVPGRDDFEYDAYDGQECSFDFIHDSLNRNLFYRLYYPSYREVTSKHHPLRGWGLIEYGHEADLKIPAALKNKIRYEEVNSR